MGDNVDALQLQDREVAEVYLPMARFLKDERKEVKIREHKYHIRATTNGRLRGSFSSLMLRNASTATLNVL